MRRVRVPVQQPKRALDGVRIDVAGIAIAYVRLAFRVVAPRRRAAGRSAAAAGFTITVTPPVMRPPTRSTTR